MDKPQSIINKINNNTLSIIKSAKEIQGYLFSIKKKKMKLSVPATH